MNEGSYFPFTDQFGNLQTVEWCAPGLTVVLDQVGMYTGAQGPMGPQGPQGVSGADAYSTLSYNFTTPAAGGSATISVVTAASFGVGMIIYIAGGGYYAVTAVNTVTNVLTGTAQNYPGDPPAGTIVLSGATVSATGPQGPAGDTGPAGPPGIAAAPWVIVPYFTGENWDTSNPIRFRKLDNGTVVQINGTARLLSGNMPNNSFIQITTAPIDYYPTSDRYFCVCVDGGAYGALWFKTSDGSLWVDPTTNKATTVYIDVLSVIG